MSDHDQKRIYTFTRWIILTHWVRVTHICVTDRIITGAGNGLSPTRHQAINWTNVDIFVNWTLRNTFRWNFDPLQWRHNGHGGVSPISPLLLNRLIWCRSNKTSKLRVTGLCAGNSPGTAEFPHKWTITRKKFPFDDIMRSSNTLLNENALEMSFAKCRPSCLCFHDKEVHVCVFNNTPPHIMVYVSALYMNGIWIYTCIPALIHATIAIPIYIYIYTWIYQYIYNQIPVALYI